jgi:N-acetylmuramoyl-L-alanine amidase
VDTLTRRRHRAPLALTLVALVGSALWWPAAVSAAVPSAVADSFVVQKNDTPRALDVLLNDTHNPSTSAISGATDPAHGTVVITTGGQGLTYQPDASYTGADSFTYTIHDTADPGSDSSATVTIKVNAPPVAVDDPGTACQPPTAFGGAFPIVEDYGQFLLGGSCGLLPNDTDSDGTIVDWQPIAQPTHGQLVYVDPNLFAYTPDADYSTIEGDLPGGQWVSDSFTYRVKDNDGGWSQPATYRIWIAPINDPPFFLQVPEVHVRENSGPYDASWLPYVSAGPPNESQQTVQFHITSGETHGVGGELFPVDHVTFTPGGHLTFTPGLDVYGYALITMYLQDDGGLNKWGLPSVTPPPDDTSDPVTFRIDVDADQAPVAVDDNATLAEDSPATAINVRSNDTDADGDIVSITATTDGAKGAVAITGSGTGLTYKPNANANGLDTFTYTIDDGHGGTDTATVHVTITPVNDPPNAVNDGVPTPVKIGTGAGPVPIYVLANDTSAPDAGESLQITSVTNGSHGVVAIGPRGLSLTYDPTGTTTGVDVFTYTISDGHGGTDTASVQVNVAADGTAPVLTTPVVTYRPTRLGSVRLTVSWTATDPESGIRGSVLQLSRDGGLYTAIALADPLSTRATVVVAAGHTYRFRVTVTSGNGLVTVSAVSRIVTL